MDAETNRLTLHIVSAHDDEAVRTVRELMSEYAALPHTHGRWPTMAADLAALPAPFLTPAGALLLATTAAGPIGCGALLALPAPGVAEIKRVYVRPDARGQGAGEALTRRLMAIAVALGFERVRLDTAPELAAAQALYRRLGFRPIPPYRDGLLPDALCFERELDR